jgi:hypothetical protein
MTRNGRRDQSIARADLRRATDCGTIVRLLTRSFGRHVGPWKKYFSLLQGDAA